MSRPNLHSPLTALLLALGLTSAPVTAQLSILRQGVDSTGTAEVGDQFGKTCAAGDFDGDGYDDVAIAAPSDVFGGGPGFRGSVTVQYGSKHGLTWKDAIELRPDHTLVPLTDKAWFGQGLAAGDFNDDGYEDLAVGAPFAVVNGQDEAGLVIVYPGSADGLTGLGQYSFTQADLGLAVEDFDRFGWALAAGPVGDADDVDDLLVGSPGENDFTGLVALLKGVPGLGLTSVDNEWYTPQSLGATVTTGSRFGYSLAIGNVTGFAPRDALVGAPFNDVGGVSNSGSAHVILGSGDGLTPFLSSQFDLTDAGKALQPEARFGWAVCIGAFSGDHALQDLAIAAPGYDGFDGRVFATDENDGSIALTRDLYAGIQAPGSTNSDEFGSALAAGDWDADGDDELAVGVPGMFGGGELHLFYGSPTGLTNGGEAHRFDDLGEPDDGDADLGRSLCFGAFAQGARQSVVAGAPAFADATGQAFDIAPWRQVQQLTCESALVANCAGEILFAMKPHEQVMIASTTKIMTALLGCEAVDRPANDPLQVDLTDVYTVEPWMGVGYPPGTLCSVFGLVPGEQIRFRDLLRTCVMRSGNDSSFAIADAMTNEITTWNGTVGSAPQFVQLMNDRATQIGMTRTLFTNPPGVDPGDPYSTAYDMYLLGREAMKNALFRDLAGTTDHAFVRMLPGNVMQPVNVSYGTLKSIQGAVPTAIGLKGGSTPGAGRTAVFAARSTSAPFGTVYGMGFGWGSSGERTTQGGWLLQLGLDTCTGGLTLPTPPVPPQPPFVPNQFLAAGSSASLNELISDYDWGSDVVLQVQSLASRGAPDGSGLLTARHDASIQLAPGATASTKLVGLSSFDGGVILNQSSAGMAMLSLRTVVDGNGETQTVVLAPMQPHPLDLPGTQSSAGEVLFEITNIGSSTAHLGVEHLASAAVTVSAGSTAPAVDGMTLSRDYQASTEGIELRLDGQGTSQHPVALVLADAASGFAYDPCLADWSEYGSGWPGSDGELPALFCDADPALGTTPDVLVSPATSAGTETLFVFLGFGTLNAPSNKGGSLLVTPDIQIVLPNIGADGLAVPLPVPNDPALCGFQLHAQLIHTDRGASAGYAFSRGLTLTFGHGPDPLPQ